ncbi:MAG: hypothetical protein V4812_10550 [Pseudomonadota bacterium]
MTWYPFHASNWPKSIIHPEDYDGGERLSISFDLGAVPEKDKNKLILKWCATLPELKHVRWLNLWSQVNQPLFDAACEMSNLESLQIKWSSIKSLEQIRRLQNLLFFSIGSSTKIESIEPVAALQSLKLLDIENFKSVSDFSPLFQLSGLESLSVTGSMWSRQKIGSLEPFASMTWLRSLCIDTSHLDSLRAFANLTKLENLGIGGRLPMEEYAWLSAKLPNTACRWFDAYLDLSASGYSPCKRCKNPSMVMLTGRGARTLCRICESGKVEKHAAAFQMIKDRAATEQA